MVVTAVGEFVTDKVLFLPALHGVADYAQLVAVSTSLSQRVGLSAPEASSADEPLGAPDPLRRRRLFCGGLLMAIGRSQSGGACGAGVSRSACLRISPGAVAALAVMSCQPPSPQIHHKAATAGGEKRNPQTLSFARVRTAAKGSLFPATRGMPAQTGLALCPI